MSFKGINVLETLDRLVFRIMLQDSSGNIVISSGGTMKLYELQSDGTLKSYDFDDNTFKTGALTTDTLSLTHQTGNNGSQNTGIYTAILTTLTGFTKGNIYFVTSRHSSTSFPAIQIKEFQFGESEGDMRIDPMENIVEDDIVRDGDGLKTSSNLYVYNNKTNATTHNKITGLIAKYSYPFTYISSKLLLLKQLRET